MKIYIACGLTHVPREVFADYAASIHGLAAELRRCSPPHEPKYALVNSDPQLAEKPFDERARLCYLWDKKMVEEADLLIAEASFASTGLGIELQIAEANNIPIIVCFRDFGTNKVSPIKYETPDHVEHSLQIGDGFVTLMALGIPSILRVIKYTDNDFTPVLATVDLLNKDR
jgi:hypothetical protein